jgi:hypothetical protein
MKTSWRHDLLISLRSNTIQQDPFKQNKCEVHFDTNSTACPTHCLAASLATSWPIFCRVFQLNARQLALVSKLFYYDTGLIWVQPAAYGCIQRRSTVGKLWIKPEWGRGLLQPNNISSMKGIKARFLGAALSLKVMDIHSLLALCPQLSLLHSTIIHTIFFVAQNGTHAFQLGICM